MSAVSCGAQATTPWTLLEAGFNFNHTKDLLRLLRDRGALAGANPYDIIK